MPPGASGLSMPALRRRQRLVLLCSGGVMTALAWSTLALGADPPRDQVLASVVPQAHPHGPNGFLLTTAMWQTMTVAMMLPVVMPWLLLYGALAPPSRSGVSTAGFASGYFTVWLAFSLTGATLQLGLSSLLSAGGRAGLARGLGGVALIVAGVFQWTPLKTACLRHCRNPLTYLVARWRDGPRGGFRMGFHHGLYCLGCCWALMTLCFVVGLMNLLWMAALTLVACVEQLAPGGPRAARLLGGALAGWGLWLALGPPPG